MTEYRLVTVWRIEAPLEVVYAAVCEPLRWPVWWPDAQRIEERRAGDAGGVGRLLRCSWQGRLPYRLDFDLLTTRIQPLVAVEGVVSGDLDGVGRCLFSQADGITTIRHEWCVRTTRRWMNLLSPCVHRLLKRNHALAMKRGAEGLARHLKARMVAFEHEELAAGPPRALPSALAAAGAGLAAGVIATAVQILLWWLSALPVLETLFRDTRLTAAIVMGRAVLAPAPMGWRVMLVATLIHVALSVVYGLVLAPLLGRAGAGRDLLAGGVFGVALYLMNLYGFTAIFPWFAVARGWQTLLAHLAFGVGLVASYRALRTGAGRAQTP